MKYGLQEDVIETIISVFSKYPKIRKAVLYGSRALGTDKPGSDIDLTLIGETITLTEITEMLVSLDELPLPYKFDLSYYAAIQNNQLRNHIDNFGVVIYERPA
ncbi:MAG: nucleotidyltransferase domain-containing protein [Bacteroidetes bacterium]|nr:nucleotidyltransferase domain-containing protein [Bacteroidota bacterium]